MSDRETVARLVEAAKAEGAKHALIRPSCACELCEALAAVVQGEVGPPSEVTPWRLRPAAAEREIERLEAELEEWKRHEGEKCPTCHGPLGDRMAYHLRAEVEESERVKDLRVQLTDARAAIRLAKARMAVLAEIGDAADLEWLASPAVQAALEEKPEPHEFEPPRPALPDFGSCNQCGHSYRDHRNGTE